MRRDPRTAFKADEITYLDRKSILMDRMLLNLFELLRFDGRPAVRRRRRSIDVDTLVELIRRNPDRFPGFASHPELTEAWLTTDLLDIMNRGKPGREMVVGPRPFHLNAFKLANPRAMKDYGASQQVWAMLYHADRPLLGLLKEFFGRGVDPVSDQYDGRTELDLETLAVLGLVDAARADVFPPTTPAEPPLVPLCTGQGRILADDLRRLLCYERSVPRHVLASYVRTIIALHLTLYLLRLFQLVPHRVSEAAAGRPQAPCPLDAGECLDVSQCPFQLEIVVDLSGDPSSPSAALAKASVASHMEALPKYVRAVLLIHRVREFALFQAVSGRRQQPRTFEDLLQVLAAPPGEMEGFFQARIADLISTNADEELDPVAQAISRLDELGSFEKYVELLCLERIKIERTHLVKLLDSLAQKNRPEGLMRQNAGPRSPRWFTFGGHLLETLVQLAVLEPLPGGGFRSHNLLIDDFIQWLRTRYGIVVYAPAFRTVPPEQQEGWRRNEQALRERLREIGFFTDLSDAYNSQTLRPRYQVNVR